MNPTKPPEHRVKYAALFNEEIRPHNERFRAAAAVRPGDRVLDIGCGTGESTREAARAAGSGTVLGMDVSAGSLELARQLSAEEGLRNVTYELADAQTHQFPPEQFDLCISRFGTMFFADPNAAFSNIGRALRPGSRLVLLVWQQREHDEWATAVHESLAPGAPVPAGVPDAFSLGDPTVTEGILAAADFTAIEFAEVHEPVYYGPDIATAYDMVTGLREPNMLLAGLDAAAAEEARDRLRALLRAHQTDKGVLFDSRAWIITARR